MLAVSLPISLCKMGKAAYVTVNDQGCFGCQAVFACHDPSVRFRSCVFLCGEVCVDKGIFGEPTLILACHESCMDMEGSRLYSMLLKMPRPSQIFTFLFWLSPGLATLFKNFRFASRRSPAGETWRGELASSCQQH
jgi:hypothetical protein